MKFKNKKAWTLAGVICTLAVGAHLYANSEKPAITPQNPSMIRVAQLSTIEANQNFQKNVQLVKAQRAQAVQLNNALMQSTDVQSRQNIQEKLDVLMAKLNENNQKMTENYGFSLNRDYTMVVEKAHVYMFVSDDEAQRVEAALKSSK